MSSSKKLAVLKLIDSLWEELSSEAFKLMSDIGKQSDYRQSFIQQLTVEGLIDVEGRLALSEDMQFEVLWPIYRGLVNLRKPIPLSQRYLHLEGELLSEEAEPAVTIEQASQASIDPRLYLWQGDITQLAVDGIVNAANKDVLGCFIPNHRCIDNIIHTKAGSQLRLEVYNHLAGRKLPVGKSIVSKAFHLPSQYIFHTVGPVIWKTPVSVMNQNLLASCYRSVLMEAINLGFDTLAFCCISTGEFNFPNDLACEIAVQTVREVLDESASSIKVIFNVFSDEDANLYQNKLAIT